MLEKYKPSIVSLTETKLNSEIKNEEVFDVNDYEVFRSDRVVQKAPGGGVAILVKRSLISGDDKVRFLNNHEYEGAVWCEIKLNDNKFLVGTIYRVPTSSHEVNLLLCDLLKLSDNYHKEAQVLICGDFDFSEIDWESNSVLSEGQHVVDARNFLDIINDCFLYQHVMQPTHNVDYDNESRLDLVFTRNLLDIEDIEFLAPIGKSHHVSILFDFLIDGSPQDSDNEECYKYCFYKGDYDKIRQHLSQVNWSEVFHGKSVIEKYEIFVEICSELIEKFVPKVKCVTSKNIPKWMTKDVKDQITQKEKAWKRLRARKTPIRAEKYRQERNKATQMIRIAKLIFDKKLCEDIKVNPKHFWSYIRSKTKIKENVLRVKKPNGQVTDSDLETANVMNNAFQSVFVKENVTDPLPTFQSDYEGPIIDEIEVETEVVEKLLKNVNVNKAMGPDGMHPKFLSECCSVIASPLVIIIKESLQEGLVPTLWKIAMVCPIFKNGSRLDPLNYRPVSLTSVICKIAEKIVRDKIVKHLEENGIISNCQHGFRQGRGTVTNLLEYMEILTKASDEQIPVDVNYLDCKKAFDTVPHKRLMAKLYGYGIQGRILKWIEGFLENRKQYVEIRGVRSDTLEVTSGVPQGSVLGPVLFLIFINDLVKELECPALLFADDAKIFVQIKSEEDIVAMERDLIKLQEWSAKWLLEFNPTKCKTMHIGHRNPNVKYEINGKELQTTEVEKDLGVYISKDLKPAHHIGVIAARANRMVGLIKRNFSYMDIEMCKTLYVSLVRPHLEYAVQSWSPYFRKDIDELEKVQRRMSKLVPELKDLSYEVRCEKLGLSTLERRRIRGDLIETFKIVHGYENVNREKFFEFADLSTRSNNCKLKKKGQWRTVARANSFSVRVINTWNNLPENIVLAPSIGAFKHRLDEYWKS